MVFIYILINMFYVIFSFKFYNNRINPISIYSAIWTTVVVLYEIKLVYYYDLTLITWVIIIISQLAYNIGCLLGKIIIGSKRNSIEPRYFIGNIDSEERSLRKAIIILSLIASISVISKLIILVGNYGWNILQYTNQIYSDRLTGDLESGIPYIGTFVFLALILTGIYFKKFGFKKFILFPVILVALDGLYGAGKLGYVNGFFLLLFPIILNNKKKIGHNTKGKKRGTIKILTSLSIFVVFFLIINKNRSTWISINSYMSPLMVNMVENSPSIYKSYTYLTTPIGVLNEFLKEPNFNFGGHTFLTIYNLLNKFGAGIPVQQYQTNYYVPIYSNVGTFIRELSEDFTIPLALIVIFILGIVFSYHFTKMMNSGHYINTILAAELAYVVFFSFFMWNFRSATTWIIILVGSITGYMLDRRRNRSRGYRNE